MSRLNSMARFDESDTDVNVVSKCAHCGREIYEGDEASSVSDSEFDAIVHSDCERTFLVDRYVGRKGTIDFYGNIN